MPRTSPFAGSPEFLRLIRGESETDLTRIALELARDVYLEMDPAAYLKRIDELSSRVRDRCPNGAPLRYILGQINWVLFVEESFRGNALDYYDPRNSYLNQVLERKTGIPISLSILYRAIARDLGLRLEGVNFPGHFMLRVLDAPEPMLVDPFHEGMILDTAGCEDRLSRQLGQPIELTDELLQPAAAGSVVARMLRNLKAIYVRVEDDERALPVIRRLAALNPDDLEEQRDLGLTCLRSNRPGEAIGPLEKALVGSARKEERDEIRSCLRVAMSAVAAMN